MANDLPSPTTFSATFADQLRAYRARAGLSQSELALRANLSVRGVSDLERGLRRAPYLPTVHALSVALNLSPAEAGSFAASVTRGRRRSRTPAYPARPETGSLPSMYTTFIGRESERAKLTELLLESAFRLVTITGPPGVGKTRLAIQVAHDIAREHGTLTVYVRLSGIHSTDQVLPAIAGAFGLSPDNPAGLLDTIVTRLGSQTCLVVLDNFEHVLPAFGDLVLLLRRCPGLRILVTSRAPLQVRGEMEFPLGPLATPPADEAEDWQTLAACPSVALFAARVREHTPDFAITPQNGATIAAISRRLEGIPLAIEIAAARSALLSPAEVLSGLSNRLEFLTDGPPDLPARQRSLEQAIAWSYRLLTNAQKRTLRLLSVLDGTWVMEEALDLLAAYARSRTARPGPVADVQSLVRHSLLLTTRTRGDDQARFHMLAMVRDFADVQLRATGEVDAANSSLIAAASGLAARIAPRLRGLEADETRSWLDDHDVVIRSALRHCLERGRLEVAGDLLWALRFWFDGEPQAWLPVWLDGALKHPAIASDALTEARLRILFGFHLVRFGNARGAGEVKQGLTLLTTPERASTRNEAIDLLQRVIRGPALAEFMLEADHCAETLATQDTAFAARALAGRGRRRLDAGRLAEAAADFNRALDLHGGDDSGRRYLCLYLGAVQILQGRLTAARQTLAGCLAQVGPDSAWRPIPYLFATLGRVHQRLDERHEAAAAYGEALRRALAVGTFYPLPLILDGVAWLASREARDSLAAQFLGAAEMQSLSPDVHSVFDSLRDREELFLDLRRRLGFHRFFTLYEEGRRMPLESVVKDAAAEITRHVSPNAPTPGVRRSPSL
jgi:predicted ATPase/DNA-binding XRE family transcriptional regulator/predicted negative regulator of RcsB-dependent stress response